MHSDVMEGQYLEPWLIAIREQHPQEAERFMRDRVARDRMNQALAMITDPNIQSELLLFAYSQGWKPDDPMWLMIIRLLGLQKTVDRDAHKVLEDLKALLSILTTETERNVDLSKEAMAALTGSLTTLDHNIDAFSDGLRTGLDAIKVTGGSAIDEMRSTSHETILELKNATAEQIDSMNSAVAETAAAIDEQGARILEALRQGSEHSQTQLQSQLALVISQVRAVDTQLAGLPDKLQGFQGSLLQTCEQAVEIYAKDNAKYIVAEEARRESDRILDDIRNLGGDVGRALQRFSVITEALKALDGGAEVVIGRFKIARRWAFAAMTMFGFGTFALGIAVALFLVNFSPFGTAGAYGQTLAAGRTYLMVYNYLSPSARSEIDQKACILTNGPHAHC